MTMPVLIDDADRGDRHGEEQGGQLGDPVKGAIGRGIQDAVPADRVDPLLLGGEGGSLRQASVVRACDKPFRSAESRCGRRLRRPRQSA
jgi:hypothetical protein